MVGQTISHYHITEKLGEGGMGVVYKAEDTKLERTVALKFLAGHLLNDEEAKARFLREAKAAAGIHHPRHEVTFLDEGPESASKLLPRVHRVASLLKRWLLGTHQGAVNPEHLDYYLDEFTFRFNRRNSRSRGKLFYRLVQQAVAIDPVPYKSIIGGTENAASVDHKM